MINVMSALGQKQTCAAQNGMSALGQDWVCPKTRMTSGYAALRELFCI